MGRVFTDDEDAVDHPAPVIVISYRLWQRRFGGAIGHPESQGAREWKEHHRDRSFAA